MRRPRIVHPFARIQPRVQRVVVLWLALACLMVGGVLQHWSRQVVGPSTPLGLLSLTLAGDSLAAERILTEWAAVAPSGDLRAKAAFILGLDFLFVALYVALLMLFCAWAARVESNPPLRRLGLALVWGQIVACALDVVENSAVAMLLFEPLPSSWPRVAQWAAVAKFALIGLGAVYCAAIWARKAVMARLEASAMSTEGAS